MGHQSLMLAVAVAAILTLGCKPSVDLPERTPAASTSSDDAATAAAEPAKDPVKADKPVNRDPGRGYLGGVASGYRHAREMIEDIPTKQAIDFFYAEEGRYPKSHEEFMEKVIRAKQMRLPEIEEGYRYEYMPDDHTLWKVPIEEEEPAPQE